MAAVVALAHAGTARASPADVPSRIFADGALLPEVLAHDRRTRTLFVGYAASAEILSLTADGRTTRFARTPGAPLGLTIDARRRRLWAGVSDLFGSRRSVLIAYDLADGRQIAAVDLPNAPKASVGSIAIEADGSALVTDGGTGAVYRARLGHSALETIVAPGSLRSPQGIAPARGRRIAVVADYSSGLWRLDVRSGRLDRIATEGPPLKGIDGISLSGRTLYVIRNGGAVGVLRIRLDSRLAAVRSIEAVAVDRPEFDEPTNGVFVGNLFRYVANSQWRRFDQAGKLKPGERADPAIILTVDP